MMKKWLILGTVMMSGLAQAQYGAQGTKVDAVLAMAQRYGSAELKGPAGEWSVEGEVEGFNYIIYFNNCNRGTRYCTDMYMTASWDAEATPAAITLWNLDTYGSKAYLDQGDFPCLELWAGLKGVSRDYLSDVFDKWASDMLNFEEDVLESSTTKEVRS